MPDQPCHSLTAAPGNSARPGYDRASGWGSVNLAGLAQAAVKLAPEIASVALAARVLG